MKGNIEERACDLAAYIIENRTTVREAAKKFGISKSTVHTDVTNGVEFLWCTISPAVLDISGFKDKAVYALSLFCISLASIRMSTHPFSPHIPYCLR